MHPPTYLSAEAQSDLNTARTLTFVAMIFQAIFLGIGIFVVMGLVYAVGPSSSGFPMMPFAGAAFVLLFLAVAGGVGLTFLLLTYFLVYKRLAEGRPLEAETPALVLGILSLFFGGVIPGILLIVAYVKAKDANTKMRWAQQMSPAPPRPS